MKNEAMLIAAKYDICMMIMVFVVSVALLLKSDVPSLNNYSIVTIIFCTAYFGVASKFLSMTANNASYLTTKKTADILSSLAIMFALTQMCFYSYLTNYAN